MFYISRAILQSIMKRRDSRLFLAFSLLPLIIPFLASNSELSNLYVEQGGKSLLSFFAIMIGTQFKMVLPTLVLFFIIYSELKSDFDSGRMFIFKDISRKKVFFNKMISIYLITFIYWLLLFTCSCFIYLLTEGRKHIVIFGSSNYHSLLTILSYALLTIIVIMLFGMISINHNLVTSILLGAIYIMTSSIAPYFLVLSYLFPNGYIIGKAMPNSSFALVVMLLLSVLYIAVFCQIGIKQFYRKEF